MLAIYPKIQITSKARISFLLYPCARIRLAAFVSVVSPSFHVSGCKVINLKPTNQIILQKYFLKNCKRTNRAFLCALCGGCAAWCKYAQNIVFYICMRARVCVCVCDDERGAKNRRKKFFLKKLQKNLEH